jgi:hypothetical protein
MELVDLAAAAGAAVAGPSKVLTIKTDTRTKRVGLILSASLTTSISTIVD